ncbi:Peroxiredoxin OsmC [compost metagenome]
MSIETDARVHFEKGDAGWTITGIDLTTRAKAATIDDQRFQQIAEETKQGCPVSRALAATSIRLNATLEGA